MTSVLGFGPGGAQRFSRNSSRSVSGDAVGTMRYPSPFFDIAHTYMPSSFKTMLKWCRYYFLSNPLINAVCYKMAEYPVTDLVLDSENENLKNKWSTFFTRVLKFKRFEVEVGLDFTCYGNSFISIFFPFIKYLKCRHCVHMERVDRVKYTFRDFKFYGSCHGCGRYDDFNVVDQHIRSMNGIRLIRWDPEQISIHHNAATGESLYYYTIPSNLANDVKMAKRHVIERIPQIFIEALRQNKSLLFDGNNIFHLKRATIAQKDKGWGLPMILPVLKDTFYLQILRKAQESICVEHIVPLRLLFPQSPSGSADVYSTINLQGWKSKIEQEILRWRLDNNYIPILPLPVGQQTLGAEGRALMLSQEYRVWAEHIVAGMGVPTEFVFGGLSYSGSNVSMRILENHFLDHKSDHHALVDWIMENVGAFMGWSPIPHHFRRFKMADDLQRSAYHLQLNQAGKLSDRSLLEDTDWDSDLEAERIVLEQKKSSESQRRQSLSQAQIQGEAQLTMQKYQMRAQKMIDEQMAKQQGQQQQAQAPQGAPPAPAQEGAMPPGSFGVESQLNADQNMGADVNNPASMVMNPGLEDIAKRVAAHLDQLSDAQRQSNLVQLRQTNPQLYSLVATYLSQRAGAHRSSANMPKPEQRAPRRGEEATT